MRVFESKMKEVKETTNYIIEDLKLTKDEFPFIYQFNDLVNEYCGSSIGGLKVMMVSVMETFPTMEDDFKQVQVERFCSRLSMYLENIV